MLNPQLMRRALVLFPLFLLLLVSRSLAQVPGANAIMGTWRNGEGTALIEIYRKGDVFCGKIVWLKEPNDATGKPRTDVHNPDSKLRTRPVKGLENLRNFTYVGEKKWENGSIYDPKKGKDSVCEMTLTADNTLAIRGTDASLTGRTDVWTRQVTK
jgi:uncharacterized protein (DUF2147 family)